MERCDASDDLEIALSVCLSVRFHPSSDQIQDSQRRPTQCSALHSLASKKILSFEFEKSVFIIIVQLTGGAAGLTC